MSVRKWHHQLHLHVEEDHHHVLHHILRGVGAKRIPLVGNAILHLDAHPDLLLPRSLTPEATLERRTLLSEVSIENWILPMAFMGIVDKVVWVRPPWSSQLTDGEREFEVGVEASSGHLRVTCAEPYFASEGISCAREEMERAAKVRLLVVPADDHAIARKVCQFLGPPDGETGLLLDVDLDFFSTRNPFLDLHSRANLYGRLRALYSFEPYPKGVGEGEVMTNYALEASKSRARLLDELEDVFKYLNDHGSLTGYSGPGRLHLDAIRDIVDAVEATAEEKDGEEGGGGVDWLQVHDAGCTCDDTELPHHVSDLGEVEELCGRLYTLLTSLGDRSPCVVTMARSSLDEFTPPEQVESIQEVAVDTIRKAYPEIEVHLDYKD